MNEDGLQAVRRAFAREIMATAGIADTRIEAAFAAVRREHFLGPGPWPILHGLRGYVPTPSSDPVYLCTDHVVGIRPERNLSNGEPSLHARLIPSAAPQQGEHIVHVGAGVGYYTAILATLVGLAGAVTAIEVDPELAARAAANLAQWPNVRVIQGDGGQVRFDPADVIYVNAGATRPASSWLDGLRDGGRLILPLTANHGPRSSERDASQPRGAVFRIERRGGEFLARWVAGVAALPCEGARPAASERALSAAFATERWREVTRLYRRDDLPADQCWLRAPGWCLAYR
jgi:protein-L-isoaspartate(D-aspartate) O-methyltransferase